MVRLGPTSRGEVEAHEPTSGCEKVHCYACHLDEPADRFDYAVCGECGHVYRSAKDLVEAYRAVAWGMLRRAWRRLPWLRGNEFESSVVEQLWRIATVRASNINFCQRCLHDF